MGYELGVDLGTTYTAAAVHRDGQVRVVELGNRAAAIPSVVLVKEDEDVLTGEAATRRAITEPDRVAREFKRRLGDPTPLLLGGRPYSAEQLQAKLLRWVVGRVAEREGGEPDRIAVTHPANWGPYKLDLLGQALRLADLDDVVTLTEPQAAAIHYASQERVEPGTLVAVYDLGGGTFDAAVLRKTDVGFEILGAPEGIERLGGIDFDEAVFAHVARALGGALDDLDPDDPSAQGAVARLRQDCVDAKEALSGDTEASIPVVLPNVTTEVRLTRAEFESLIRPPLADTITAMQRALRSADVAAGDLSAVLLVGGSSRIPLVAQLVGAELGRPVAVDAHPKYGVAMGAALAATAAEEGHDVAAVSAGEAEEALPGAAAISPAAATGGAGIAATGAATATPAASAEVPAEAPAAEPRQPTEQLAAVAAAPPTGAMPAGGSSAGDGAGGDGPPTRQRAPQPKSRVPIVLGVIALVALVAFFLRPKGDTTPDITSGTESETEPVTLERSDEPTPSDSASDEPTAEATTEPVDPDSAEARGIDSPGSVLWLTLTDIVLDERGRYIVEYETTNYDALVGNGVGHVHFYWPLWEPGTVGVGGGAGAAWAAWPPAAGEANAPLDSADYTQQQVPDGVTQICAVVANDDHSVNEPATAEERGHCIDLPE